MTAFEPSIMISDGVLKLGLTPELGIRDIDLDCVVDQTGLGDVVGIEILDLRQQLCGGHVPVLAIDGFPRWSYDSEIDAFYVRVGEGRAQVQKASSVVAHLDREDRLCCIELGVAL